MLKKTIIISLLLSLKVICNEVIIAKTINDRDISIDYFIDRISKNENINSFVFHNLNKEIIIAEKDILKFAKTTTSLLSNNIKLKLKTNDPDVINNYLEYIIEVRNLIFKGGGRANLCISGSITKLINFSLWYMLINEISINKEIITLNNVNLFDGFLSIDEVKNYLNNLDLSHDKTINNIDFVKAFAKSSFDMDSNLSFSIWMKCEPHMSIAFNKDVINDGSIANLLYNWVFALDELESIQIIYEINLNENIFSLDDRERKRIIMLNLDPDKCMLTSLNKWKAKKVNDYYRKFNNAGFHGKITAFDFCVKYFVSDY